MKKHKLDLNRAFQNIIEGAVGGSEGEVEAPTREDTSALPKSQPQKALAPTNEKVKQGRKNEESKLTLAAFYITKRQHRALKLKAAFSDGAIDKDQSAIVRAALDSYLSDTLKKLES
jgi:hypothetical protein